MDIEGAAADPPPVRDHHQIERERNALAGLECVADFLPQLISTKRQTKKGSRYSSI